MATYNTVIKKRNPNNTGWDSILPITTATNVLLNESGDTVATELANKVDKVSGKGLSTEDYTTTEKTKLAGIESGANKYTHPSTHPASMIVESASRRFVSDTEKAAWNAKAEDAHNHVKADITDMPTKLSEFQNDIGAGAGLNIVVSPTEPAGLSTGDWWYKEV